MRVLVLVKESEESETGAMPPEGLVEAMNRFNEDLARAGVLLAADGLYPSSKAVRVRFDGKQRTVIDGPFAETKELVSGYWLWQVKSMDEAIEWLKRAPFEGGDVEIRPIFESEDFQAQLPPELRGADQRWREQLAARKP